MESHSSLTANRAPARRRQMQLLHAMLRALAKPLLLTRQARRCFKNMTADGHVARSIEILLQELSNGAQAVTRRLNAMGVREPRRSVLRKTTARLHRYWASATEWSQHVIAACQGCASRLCSLFRAAQALEDRTISQLAYSLLRTLEKELWLLKSDSHPPWHALRA